MFWYGIAHILLLGLLADFYAHWIPSRSRKKRNDRPQSPYVLPKQVCKEISRRAALLQLTDFFKKPYRDIIKYVATCDIHAALVTMS